MATARRWLGFILCGTCCLTFAQTESKGTRRHVRVAEQDPSAAALAQAEDAISKKDYANAEKSLVPITQRDPANYQAWFDLGFTLNALGRTDESIAAYRKSVAAKPDVFESNLNLGLMLARAGEPDAAQFLRAATKLKPTEKMDEGHARAWVSLGHVVETSNPDEALEAFRQAIALQPKDPEPHNFAAILLERQKKLTEAEKEYQAVLALEPNSTEAALALANIYMQSQRLPEAEEMLRKLAAAKQTDPSIHLQLGRLLAGQKKFDEAASEMELALKANPRSVEAQRELADLYSAAGQHDRAESAYRELLKSQGPDAALHHSLGIELLRQKKFAAAQEELLAAVKLKPDLGPAYGDLATAASENKNYELAIKALDARAKFLPEIPVGYFLRATAYDHLRDFKNAAVNYHLFLDNANGQYPDQEWQARHRLIAIEPKK
ncbi:MAG TPA: tetratricopeptide repeat protein [Terriglobales bacterium]|jgi:tetratricopeptide (TPR) repeat protein|nr:tetratricopeptide repeat protein [Terriglobales bacterium]